jgi:hypothetical protein
VRAWQASKGETNLLQALRCAWAEDDTGSPRGVSLCTRNCIMTGLRFLFRVTLRRLDLAAEIYHVRQLQKILLVMSADPRPLINKRQKQSDAPFI